MVAVHFRKELLEFCAIYLYARLFKGIMQFTFIKLAIAILVYGPEEFPELVLGVLDEILEFWRVLATEPIAAAEQSYLHTQSYHSHSCQHRERSPPEVLWHLLELSFSR